MEEAKPEMEMNDIILSYPKLSRADLATLAAITELGSKTLRDDIAALAQISPRQVTRACNRLQAEGLLINNRIYDRETGKTRFTRVIPSQSDKIVTLPPSQSDKIVTLPPPKNGPTEPYGAKGQNCHPSCMYDDDDVKREIEKILSFFDAPGLEKLFQTPHLSPELAQAWANHKVWRDINNKWAGIKNPEGYIFSQLSKGNWPTAQQELPEAAEDLTDQMQGHPMALMGAKFINGMWK